MPGRDIIVVGASVGGIEVLRSLARGLPPDLAAAVFVVCHFPGNQTSVLPDILSREGPLPARHARDGEPIHAGRIYVARPDLHLLVQPGRVRLSHGPRENRFRPAIDPLFRTAARSYGRRVIAVLLTGGLNDGVAGLLAVRASGGLAVVQDPADAQMPSLPQGAIAVAGADHVVAAGELAPLLSDLVRRELPEGGPAPMTDPVEQLSETIRHDQHAQSRNERLGEPSVYGCPECGGVLWQVDQKEMVRFRCHVGHAYYAEHLLEEQAEALEAALWTAVRTFKDRAGLSRQLANRERELGNATSGDRFDEQAAQAERYASLIQEVLLSPPVAPAAEPDARRPAPDGAPDQ